MLPLFFLSPPLPSPPPAGDHHYQRHCRQHQRQCHCHRQHCRHQHACPLPHLRDIRPRGQRRGGNDKGRPTRYVAPPAPYPTAHKDTHPTDDVPCHATSSHNHPMIVDNDNAHCVACRPLATSPADTHNPGLLPPHHHQYRPHHLTKRPHHTTDHPQRHHIA